jgi:hypothetical protein
MATVISLRGRQPPSLSIAKSLRYGMSRWIASAARNIRILYVIAFPIDRCALGIWLTLLVPGAGAPVPHPDPDAPIPKAAALREGALLYEVASEPCSSVHLP